ncbi:MAG: hypothetical protein KC418_09220 [Anaerolineales bacterium]|nr:hypothetical protein [Anaerolineales bacterium]MCB8954468.1 hypothetical protein [Ardenticatenales bacterium]
MTNSADWSPTIEDFIIRKQHEIARQQARRYENIGLLAGSVAAELDTLLRCLVTEMSQARDLLPAEDPAQAHFSQTYLIAEQAAELCSQFLDCVNGCQASTHLE